MIGQARPTCRTSGGSGRHSNGADPRPTCRTSGGSGLSWSSSPDLPDVWRVGLVLQLLVRPAECLAGRVCPATPCKTCRTSGGSGLSRAPCPTCWTSGRPGLELLTNLVRRVGTRLTELLANRFAMQCNKKFNEMRSPVITQARFDVLAGRGVSRTLDEFKKTSRDKKCVRRCHLGNRRGPVQAPLWDDDLSCRTEDYASRLS